MRGKLHRRSGFSGSSSHAALSVRAKRGPALEIAERVRRGAEFTDRFFVDGLNDVSAFQAHIDGGRGMRLASIEPRKAARQFAGLVNGETAG